LILQHEITANIKTTCSSNCISCIIHWIKLSLLNFNNEMKTENLVQYWGLNDRSLSIFIIIHCGRTQWCSLYRS
jgi:hypothetical protein